MTRLLLLDAAPDPVGIGALLAVVLLVLSFLAVLAVALVIFLWYRKRSLRGVEMIRPDLLPTGEAQTGKPNQP